MRPHSNDTLVLPFSPFPHPRFTGLQEGSLHFGRDDDTGERMGSYLGDMLRVLELAVLYYDTNSPLL